MNASVEHASEGSPAAEPFRGVLSAVTAGRVAANKFRVRVMGTGFGKNFEDNRQWYVPDTAEGIGSARRTFAGARVHWHKDGSGDFNHVDKSMRDWLGTDHDVGYLSDLELVEGGLEATLVLHDDVPEDIREVIASKEVGLSIEAWAERRPSIRGGVAVVELVNFRHGDDGTPASVAIVSNPALRGEILRVAASKQEKKNMSETNAAIEAELSKVKAAREESEKLLAAQKVETARLAVNAAISKAEMPEKSADLVRDRFADAIGRGEAPSAEALSAAIEKVRAAANDVKASGTGTRIEFGADGKDKLELRLETLFARNDPSWRRKNVAEVFGGKTLEDRRAAAGLPRRESEGSILRIFREATGHEFADLQKSDKSRAVRASITSSTFNDAWENVLNRRFIASFENPDFSDWRKMTRVVPLQNFVKQERMVKGGYANLASVAEGANYQSMTSPADQGHGYTPTKRGGTEDVTWEAFLRDDVGALDVGPSLGMAAARTLYEFVFDLYADGTVTMDYDTTALYHANHGNKGTTALSGTELIVAYKAMLKQADISNSKRLMVTPKYLLVPIDLMNTAFDLLKSLVTFPGGSTTDNEFVRRMQLEAIVVRHWTDTNNWYLAADPMACPAAEVGFVGGNEAPELFVQDDRNLGSFFNADKITYKLRHAYGGTVLRHETVYGEVVA